MFYIEPHQLDNGVPHRFTPPSRSPGTPGHSASNLKPVFGCLGDGLHKHYPPMPQSLGIFGVLGNQRRPPPDVIRFGNLVLILWFGFIVDSHFEIP